MDIVGWILVAILAVAVAVLLFRRPESRYASAVDRLARQVERGDNVAEPAPEEPPEVSHLRRALRTGWSPVRAEEDDPGDRALRGLVRYLKGAAIEPLERALRNGGPVTPAMREVVHALEDLEFYAEEPQEEEVASLDLVPVVQEVAREYTRETEIPVKLRFASPTVPGAIPETAFRDALFMLLANAGRFGRGETVVVEVERGTEGVRVRVVDRGDGFTPEALERAFDPFWSTDADAVGLGLTYARRRLAPRGLAVEVGNRQGEGGEAVILVPGS